MTNFRQHSVQFLKKWAENKKGFVVSLPNSPFTQHAEGETVLGEDITVTSDAVLKTVNIKAFSKSETVPSLGRVVIIENKLETFISKEAYLQSEATQNQNILTLLNTLDVKDLDVADFLTAVANLATKAQVVALTTALDVEKQINLEQKNQIAQLTKEMTDRVVAELNFAGPVLRNLDPLSGVWGAAHFNFLIPEDYDIHCVRVFAQGIKLQHTSYSFTQLNDDNRKSIGGHLKFVDDAVSNDAVLDIEVSFKKKIV